MLTIWRNVLWSNTRVQQNGYRYIIISYSTKELLPSTVLGTILILKHLVIGAINLERRTRLKINQTINLQII